MKHICTFLLGCVYCGAAMGQTPGVLPVPDSAVSRRADVAAQRLMVEQKSHGEKAACYEKFAVNRCIGEVNTRRQKSLAALRVQDLQLNDAERKEKGEIQRRKTDEKSSPAAQQSSVAQRASASADFQPRNAQAADRQQESELAQSKVQTYWQAALDRQENHQKKMQLRAEKKTHEAEKAVEYTQHQQSAEQRRIELEANRLKQAKPAAASLPIPE